MIRLINLNCYETQRKNILRRKQRKIEMTIITKPWKKIFDFKLKKVRQLTKFKPTCNKTQQLKSWQTQKFKYWQTQQTKF